MSDVVCCKRKRWAENHGLSKGADENMYVAITGAVGWEYSKLIEKNGRMRCEDCGQVYGAYQIGSDNRCYFRLPWTKQKPWLHRFMMKRLLGWEWKWI